MMIASRILKLKISDREIAIPVTIFAPKHEGDAWSCSYEIDWPEGKETTTAWGFDSVQALVVALQMIGAELYSSSYHKSGKLMLEAPGNGCGFPVVSSLRDMLEGDDAKVF
jgi:hypothetical protein